MRENLAESKTGAVRLDAAPDAPCQSTSSKSPESFTLDEATLKEAVSIAIGYLVKMFSKYVWAEIVEAVDSAARKVRKNCAKYDPNTAKFSTYFTTIARNSLIDILRKRTTRNKDGTRQSKEMPLVVDPVGDAAPQPSVKALLKDMIASRGKGVFNFRQLRVLVVHIRFWAASSAIGWIEDKDLAKELGIEDYQATYARQMVEKKLTSLAQPFFDVTPGGNPR